MVGLLALVFPKRGNLSQSSCMLDKKTTLEEEEEEEKHLPTHQKFVSINPKPYLMFKTLNPKPYLMFKTLNLIS